MYWLAQAPANIALIKYMGKKKGSSNLPDNASLSYTLDNLVTTVQLKLISAEKDCWQPLAIADNDPHLKLSAQGQQRFIDHLLRIKKLFSYTGTFLIQSNNNFPFGSGLASSASSFAALTRCAVIALSDLTGVKKPSVEEQAQLSRIGSGSSCRSFYTPWALWKEDEVFAVDLPYSKLIHQVVIISSTEKKVSSSEAHQRVKTSALYQERSERAETRLEQLLSAFKSEDWSSIYQLCWDDFQDMHRLFSSCDEPFSYISEESIQVLNQLRGVWERYGDGPLVTMDAGPNIHLLYRLDQKERAAQFKADFLTGKYHVL